MYHQRNNLQRWAILTVLFSVSLSLLSACGADTPTTAPAATVGRATTSANATTASTTSASISTSAAVKTVAAVPNGNRTGVTDTEIKLGGVAILSGPLSIVGTNQQTMKAYFKMINDQGGIYGRKINYILEDNALDSVKTETAVKKLVEQDQVFALSGVHIIDGTSLLDYTDQKGVPVLPLINVSNELSGTPRKLVFGGLPIVDPEGKFVVDYAADQLGCKKLAVLYDSDQVDSISLKSFLAEAQAKQLQVTAKLVTPTNPADFAPMAATLQQTGTDFIYVLSLGPTNPTGGLLKEVDKLGYKLKAMLTYYNNGVEIYQQLGKVADGIYSSWFALQPDGDDIKSVQFQDFLKKYMPDSQLPIALHQEGYIMAQITVEALRRAGKDLTRESLVAAAESIVNWRESYANTITYGPLNRVPISSFYVTQYKDGKIQKISDWYTVK
jgi:branched-chain amino acid transport system substrate-binding protein